MKERSPHIDAMLRAPEERSWTLDEAYRYCKRITVAHYENFPVASLLIPRRMRPHIAAIYAFARTADDFADEPGLSDHERLDALRGWRERLAECSGRSVRHPIFQALRETMGRFDLPEELFGRLLTAFESDVLVRRFETRESLLRYCRNSADPVGRLVLLLFGYRDEELLVQSDRICTALQLTNFWQDLSIDLQKDRVYLPQEDLRRWGVPEADLFEARRTSGVRTVLAEMVSWTRQLFDEGQPLLDAVGWDLKLELRLTAGGGMAVLHRIQAGDVDVLRHRPSLSRRDKLTLLLRSLVGL